MILPIIAYGDSVLRKVGTEIDKEYPNLKELIANMWETMYNANGVGLAAPQIGLPIRLFLVDTTPFADDEDLTVEEKKELEGFKQVFVNAYIEEETGDEWAFNEGCLSIPDVREDVNRKGTIKMTYEDENFIKQTKSFDGLLARVI
ncbi:MAG: peptide deformylase, partial [Maribacter sp.]